MNRSSAIAAVTALCAFAASAQNLPPACPAPPHTQVFHSMRTLNGDVRSALLAKVPDIVDSNQPFDATYVVMHGAHFNRFAFAWQRNGRWIVITEHGGIASYNPIYTVAFPPTLPATGGRPSIATYTANIVNTIMSRPSKLCEDASRALTQKLPALPPAKPQSITR